MERGYVQDTHACPEEDKPRPKTARKIIWILLLLFIALLTILFFRSPVSQVTDIEITGNTFNTDEQLLEESGVRVGDQFLVLIRIKLVSVCRLLARFGRRR